MHGDSIISSIFLVFAGAAVLSTIALYTRQSMLVAYMLLGLLLGPSVFNLAPETEVIKQIGNIGIIFLLFLLGLNLHPQNLLHMLSKTIWVGVVSSIVFAVIGFGISYAFGFSMVACIAVAAAMMFSSTIIGLKLLPTTILHHQHTGEVMISILLFQDILAIIVLLLLYAAGDAGISLLDIAKIVAGFPGLILAGFLIERYVLQKLFMKFDRIQEYVFLVAIGWCLTMAELAKFIGLSDEIGAFIAGVVLAASPIALYISESLKPLRDFFLVMFFFSIGANYDLSVLPDVWLPALILAALMLVVKPVVFGRLLSNAGETKPVSWEVGMRLGQISEFSLLVAYISAANQLIEVKASYLIQTATLITFIASSYIVVMKYPTPMAMSDRMRRS